ncbi:hypothetical protein Btru_066235 [Bulinus truncatus]|nr:hypothetical protein Btru_066235 [Bulinus truncatus]
MARGKKSMHPWEGKWCPDPRVNTPSHLTPYLIVATLALPLGHTSTVPRRGTPTQISSTYHRIDITLTSTWSGYVAALTQISSTYHRIDITLTSTWSGYVAALTQISSTCYRIDITLTSTCHNGQVSKEGGHHGLGRGEVDQFIFISNSIVSTDCTSQIT